MAFLTCDFSSEALGMMTELRVILPEQPRTRPLSDYPVLYLLHGLSDNGSAWSRRSAIERYADEFGIAVVMPSAGRSFYCNMAYGQRWWDYISEEVPAVARRFFGLSDARDKNMVAGLSMGGYGAMRHALIHPDRYFAACALSGVLDLTAFANMVADQTNGEFLHEAKMIFGDFDAVPGSDMDILHMLRTVDKDSLPRLYQYCGTEDFLYTQNQNFLAAARERNIGLHYVESRGDHRWKYWDKYIYDFLSWVFAEKTEK